MIFSTYNNFCNAINNNEVNMAENIFAYSDVRHSLINYCIENCAKDTVISTIEAFTSKGLKEQALNICNTCSIQDCKIKQTMLENKNVVHYIDEENQLLNKKYHAYNLRSHKRFDIHSGKYI